MSQADIINTRIPSGIHIPTSPTTTADQVRARAAAVRAFRIATYARPEPVAPVIIPPTPRRDMAQLLRRAIAYPAITEPPAKPGRVTIATVIATACRVFDVSRAEIVGESRKQPLLFARQASVIVSCRLTGHSCAEVGRRHGNRDHTTILSTLKRYEVSAPLQAAVTRLTIALEGDDANA